ncbi:interleukin-1 receptor-like 2 isoform X3 [Phyllopteryx taeniolatus]|uniref:interleukin-1 receptor-like 2 isoform X3 n=1 Tax=Phyllopteryx taeniolatus TaxID=161469 RepID=UPI002AD38E10|nr:interleukin-1 receptor-like 2 isoform X3 [Phyllopteryx taeniolatus]
MVMCVHVRTLPLLLVVVAGVDWTHAAQDECKDYQVQFERVFSVPGDAAMINCTLASPDVFNLSAASYEVDWYRAETGRRLRNASRRVLIRGETLWLLNVTMQHDGHYQCVLRTSAARCYKQSTRLVVERPVRGECGRPRKATQLLTVGVTDTLSCPIKEVLNKLRSYAVPASVTWYRGCDVIENGFDGHAYRDRARLKIQDVDTRNNHSYTCTLNFNLGGVAASMSETIQAWVQEDYCFLPQVLQPADDIVKAARGSRLKQTCRVFVPCIGTVPDDPVVDLFWLDDINFISTNNSERIFASEPRVWRASDSPKGMWLESVLTISSLEDTDFLVNYTCRVYSARGWPQAHFALLPQEPDVLVAVGCVFGGMVALVVFALVVYFHFKIDMVLFFRSSFPICYANEEKDGKQFDAYVTSYYPLSCQLDISHEALTFALHVLPQVLEKACGYRLFIAGRDSLPGQATVDSVHDNMMASRRLLLLYGASSFACTHRHHNDKQTNNNNNNNTNNNNVGEYACLEPRRQHECAVAMHQALMEGTLKVVLVELEEVSAAQLALFPESLRHLRRKQGAVCWWKNHKRHNQNRQQNQKSWTTCTKKSSPSRTSTQDQAELCSSPCLSPSSRFWKEIRYHMPVRGKRAAPHERISLLKV